MRDDLPVKPRDDLFTPRHPLVPVLPDKWTSITFGGEKLDAIMKLAHAFCDLL